MKFLVLILFIMILNGALANEVKIEINPPKPVAGEVFQAYFRVFTDSDHEPVINFSPSGMEVVDKNNQGISTRTVYDNGKLTVSRERTIVYDLVASQAGSSYLRDITVQIGSSVVRHPNISVVVLKEAEVLAEIFVMADVPKKSLYIGEGVVVRYHLYSKVPVSNLDIKKYPKLNNFMKRYLQEQDRSERVSVNGQIYLRSQIYAAKLFPEKTGELKVDSLHLSATYPVSRAGDPFSTFGLNRDFRSRTLMSEQVKVEVKPFPQPVPSHFTGLVGKHEFDLHFNQQKLIVNEPLEVKLTVSGGGALENLEAPQIIKHKGFEEFESNGDLKIADAERAIKTFNYTFLARENLKLPASTLTLSYFEPNSEKYISIQLDVPEIMVAGGVASATPPPTEKVGPSKVKRPSAEKKEDEILGPIAYKDWEFKKWLPYLNLALAVSSVLIALGWIVRRRVRSSAHGHARIPLPFKRGQFSLGEFTKWISPLISKSGKSPWAVIRESGLEEDTKSYFIDLLNSNDYKDYSVVKGQMNFKYNSGHFKKLGRYIESATDESPSQSA